MQADSELSADIARHNFDRIGSPEGCARIDACIADIVADRDRSYGWTYVSP